MPEDPEVASVPDWLQVAREAAPLLGEMLRSGRGLHLLEASREGLIRFCSPALARLLQRKQGNLIGKWLWDFVIQDDAAALRERIALGGQSSQSFLINFTDGDNNPFTLVGWLAVKGDSFFLAAETPAHRNAQSQEELMHLNNEMAVLSREHARKTKELEKTRLDLSRALEDLKHSYWHLKKIQEVLPVCMECGKIKTQGQWEDVIQYLKDNANFLSHGYCPECVARLLPEWQKTLEPQ